MKHRCPHCNSKEYVKNGFMKGKQRYKCKNRRCGRNFILRPAAKKDNLVAFEGAVVAYINGKGVREISRSFNVSHVTIINWLKIFLQKFTLYINRSPYGPSVAGQEYRFFNYLKSHDFDLGNYSCLRQFPIDEFRAIIPLIIKKASIKSDFLSLIFFG